MRGTISVRRDAATLDVRPGLDRSCRCTPYSWTRTNGSPHRCVGSQGYPRTSSRGNTKTCRSTRSMEEAPFGTLKDRSLLVRSKIQPSQNGVVKTRATTKGRTTHDQQGGRAMAEAAMIASSTLRRRLRTVRAATIGSCVRSHQSSSNRSTASLEISSSPSVRSVATSASSFSTFGSSARSPSSSSSSLTTSAGTPTRVGPSSSTE